MAFAPDGDLMGGWYLSSLSLIAEVEFSSVEQIDDEQQELHRSEHEKRESLAGT